MEQLSRVRSLTGLEFKLPWASLSAFSRAVLRTLPVRSNPPRRGGFVTVCKYNGRKRRSAGKSAEENQKDFIVWKEESLCKSTGGVRFPSSEVHNEEDGLEFAGSLLLANGDGAISVSALQPIDESYYPLTNSSARDRFQPSAVRSVVGNYSLPDSFSEFVAWNAVAQERGSQSATPWNTRVLNENYGTTRSAIEHTVNRTVEERPAAGSGVATGGSFSSPEKEDEEWVEIVVDDVEEDESEEKVEYWEGDLPSMTPEEEDLLLREAERELAEMERLGDAGKNSELILIASETVVKSKKNQLERKLSKLKTLVQQMEEEIEEDEKQTASSAGPISEVYSKGLKSKFGNVHGENDVDGGQQPNGSDEIRIESKRLNLQYRHHRHDYWEGDDEEEEEEVKVGRGVPAVMRCFDRAKIYVKAGDGGNGVVAFRREKFVPFGGPFGGNGGRGGQVYFEADSSMNSLLPFRKVIHFRAGRGSHGGGKRKEGAVGVDCTVRVPPGTVIREAGPEGKVLLELTRPGQREMLLPGGAGGRGNAAFKTGRNNAPQLAEFGEAGVEMWIELELKLVADVGIVGVPNAGKSTLLSAISAAKPEIANYPFTTLLPNLGVVALDYDATMVVADLPGLLEGAHTGAGLGHEFLRHTERCRVLVHVVDGMSLQPVEEFEAVRLELLLFNSGLVEKPFVVAFNKMDIPEAAEQWDAFQHKLQSKGINPFCMSATTQQGTREVSFAAHALVKEQKGSDAEGRTEGKEKVMAVAEKVRKQRSAPIEDFTIQEDKHTRTWQVIGAGLERFTQMTNWEYFEAVRRFQHVLSASGVSRALKDRGIQEGDLVIVGQMKFDWMDSEDMSDLADWKRGVRGSKVWPH